MRLTWVGTELQRCGISLTTASHLDHRNRATISGQNPPAKCPFYATVVRMYAKHRCWRNSCFTAVGVLKWNKIRLLCPTVYPAWPHLLCFFWGPNAHTLHQQIYKQRNKRLWQGCAFCFEQWVYSSNILDLSSCQGWHFIVHLNKQHSKHNITFK